MTVTSPMMIDPAFISRLRPRNATTGELEPDEVLEHAEKAMTTGKAAADALDSVVRALAQDATQTDAAKAVQIRKIALAQGEKAAKQLDTAKARAAEAISILERELTPDVADDISEKFAPTVLARLSAMKHDERQKVMAQAIESNDPGTLCGVSRAGVVERPWRSRDGNAARSMAQALVP
jgi:hypothetical protein